MSIWNDAIMVSALTNGYDNKDGWHGENGKYKTMKKTACRYCGKKIYNNGISTHEYYCKKKFTNWSPNITGFPKSENNAL